MSDLVTFDPSTGLATTVGPTGMGPIGGLAYDPKAGVMYGTESSGQSAGSFVTVDLNTGAATLIGLTGFLDVAALDFDPSTGILYGGIGGSDPNAGSLITIDPSTGAGTLVGPTGFPVLSGVTFCGAPVGACCVVDTEICTDDQAQEECDAQGGEWHESQSCGDILCPPPPVEPCGGANESFETGDFSGWLTQDMNIPFSPLMVGGAGISPGFRFFSSDPTDGLFAALHGWDGDGPGMISIAQDVALPAGTTEVIFDYRAAWNFFSGTQDRTFEVAIRPEGGGPPLQPPTLILTAGAGTAVLDTGDLVGSVDVSDFDGNTVQVSFEWFVPEFFTGPAFFQLDNIQCLGCGNDEDCDDDNACTIDECIDALCVNTPIDCEDGDACTADSCEAGTGCVHAPLDCPEGEVCVGGDCVPVDSDGDGVPDVEDDCPESDLNPTIVIDDCETGVENEMLDDGCTMADLITQCAEDVVDHGAFVRCVSNLTNLWKCRKIINGREKGAIMTCAAQSSLP